jgi:mono/diheme cytochrome c family protein
MRGKISACGSLIALMALGIAPPVAGQDMERGRKLFDTHCIACHSKALFNREKRIVHNRAELVAQVKRWQTVAGQQWTATEVDDVANYLDERFYKLSTPR